MQARLAEMMIARQTQNGKAWEAETKSGWQGYLGVLGVSSSRIASRAWPRRETALAASSRRIYWMLQNAINLGTRRGSATREPSNNGEWSSANSGILELW